LAPTARRVRKELQSREEENWDVRLVRMKLNPAQSGSELRFSDMRSLSRLSGK
jgi:hypothetical protein